MSSRYHSIPLNQPVPYMLDRVDFYNLPPPLIIILLRYASHDGLLTT
jgi:hypothetical protein